VTGRLPKSRLTATGPGREHARKHGLWPPPQPPRRKSTGALYRNNGNGTFSDVTRGSGLEIEMQGFGVAAGDYDNDGREDLLVTSVGAATCSATAESNVRGGAKRAGVAKIKDGPPAQRGSITTGMVC
jgi:hypothetical protein